MLLLNNNFQLKKNLFEHKHIDFWFHNGRQFEVTIQDDAGSTTTMISDKIGEKLFSLTLAEIHDIRCIKVKHSTTSCLLLKNLSYMISLHLSETTIVTHTGATHTAREHIHYPNKEAVCKKQGCIFSKTVYHVNHRKRYCQQSATARHCTNNSRKQ